MSLPSYLSTECWSSRQQPLFLANLIGSSTLCSRPDHPTCWASLVHRKSSLDRLASCAPLPPALSYVRQACRPMFVTAVDCQLHLPSSQQYSAFWEPLQFPLHRNRRNTAAAVVAAPAPWRRCFQRPTPTPQTLSWPSLQPLGSVSGAGRPPCRTPPRDLHWTPACRASVQCLRSTGYHATLKSCPAHQDRRPTRAAT